MVEVTRYSNKTYAEAAEFYKSDEWKQCRKEFLITNRNRECVFCKTDVTPKTGKAKLNVDHIKPLRYYWDLRLELSNLQITCEECNKLKGTHNNPEQGRKNYFNLYLR